MQIFIMIRGLFRPVVGTTAVQRRFLSVASLLPTKLLTKAGAKATSEVLTGKKVVALYFSAHWCPPCRGFTPVASEFYKKLALEDPNALEVIFISSDEDEKAFSKYYDSQPWAAVPFSSPETQTLGAKFGVRGIPSLIVLNAKTGEVVDQDGRSTVLANKDQPVGAMTTWK